VAITVNLFRHGAVGFSVWLGRSSSCLRVTNHMTAAKMRRLMTLVTTFLGSAQNSVSRRAYLTDDPAPNHAVIQIVHVRR
jgi:hypothetical protein